MECYWCKKEITGYAVHIDTGIDKYVFHDSCYNQEYSLILKKTKNKITEEEFYKKWKIKPNLIILRELENDINLLRTQVKKIDIFLVVQSVIKAMNLNYNEVLKLTGRKRTIQDISRARQIIIYLLITQFGYTMREVHQTLSPISTGFTRANISLGLKTVKSQIYLYDEDINKALTMLLKEEEND